MGIRLSNVLTKNKNMFHISLEIKRQVDVKLKLIADIERQLIYAARFKKKVPVTFADLMNETHDILDITQPAEKHHNTNKNQNLY